VRYIVGNHGLEPGARLGKFEREIVAAREVLEKKLEACPGLDIEDKRYSLAIHFRRSRQRVRARRLIGRAVAALASPMRIVPGKQVVNVIPAGAPNKGDALQALRDQADADVALYAGDDVTDEDVFGLDQPGRLFSVRIGMSGASAARYYLRAQREMDALLSKLASLRERRER
jgi:trehalose 6-phosphate phosphatase